MGREKNENNSLLEGILCDTMREKRMKIITGRDTIQPPQSPDSLAPRT